MIIESEQAEIESIQRMVEAREEIAYQRGVQSKSIRNIPLSEYPNLNNKERRHIATLERRLAWLYDKFEEAPEGKWVWERAEANALQFVIVKLKEA